MGVYINMKMPENCDDCRLNNGISCYAVPEYTEDGVVGRTEDRPDWCPLVPIPPHGRLIDQDAILREVIRGDYPNQWIDKNELLRLFRNAQTIIEAEEKKV